MLTRIGIPLVANVVGKLFGGYHRGGEDEDEERIRFFKSLLPMIDQGEVNVTQSRNGLVIRSQPAKRDGAVIPALKYILSGDKKRVRSSSRTKQSIQSNTFVGGSVVNKPEFINHPISNFEITNWAKYFNINNFKGVISRDEIRKKVKYILNECFMIDLNNTEGSGTHWVAVKITKDYVNYSNSFGLQPPQQLSNLCYTFNKLYKYE